VELISLILGFIVGAGTSIGNAFNVSLSKDLGDLGAAWVFFATSTLCCVTLIVLKDPSQILNLNFKILPWYLWSSGFINILGVIMIIFATKSLGLYRATLVILSSQIFFSLIFDHLGLMGIPKISFSLLRMFGFLVLILGCGLSAEFSSREFETLSLAGFLVAFFAGFCVAFTGILNVGVAAYLDILRASLSYFLPGTVLLGIWCFLSDKKFLNLVLHQKTYLYLVGVINTLLIIVQTWSITFVGEGLFFSIFFIGQTAMALWINSKGYPEMERTFVTPRKIGALSIAVFGLLFLYGGSSGVLSY